MERNEFGDIGVLDGARSRAGRLPVTTTTADNGPLRGSLMPDVEITLVDIATPAIRRDNRTIALPVASWLSAGFWDLFGLPAVDSVLNALSFGTERSPRTYIARIPDEPPTWTSTPLTVHVPATIGAGPGVLWVSGAMTDELRRVAECTGLVITLGAPGRRRLHRSRPVKVWEPHRWHTAILVPRDELETPSPPHESESVLPRRMGDSPRRVRRGVDTLPTTTKRGSTRKR